MASILYDFRFEIREQLARSAIGVSHIYVRSPSVGYRETPDGKKSRCDYYHIVLMKSDDPKQSFLSEQGFTVKTAYPHRGAIPGHCKESDPPSSAHYRSQRKIYLRVPMAAATADVLKTNNKDVDCLLERIKHRADNESAWNGILTRIRSAKDNSITLASLKIMRSLELAVAKMEVAGTKRRYIDKYLNEVETMLASIGQRPANEQESIVLFESLCDALSLLVPFGQDEFSLLNQLCAAESVHDARLRLRVVKLLDSAINKCPEGNLSLHPARPFRSCLTEWLSNRLLLPCSRFLDFQLEKLKGVAKTLERADEAGRQGAEVKASESFDDAARAAVLVGHLKLFASEPDLQKRSLWEDLMRRIRFRLTLAQKQELGIERSAGMAAEQGRDAALSASGHCERVPTHKTVALQAALSLDPGTSDEAQIKAPSAIDWEKSGARPKARRAVIDALPVGEDGDRKAKKHARYLCDVDALRGLATRAFMDWRTTPDGTKALCLLAESDPQKAADELMQSDDAQTGHFLARCLAKQLGAYQHLAIDSVEDYLGILSKLSRSDVLDRKRVRSWVLQPFSNIDPALSTSLACCWNLPWAHRAAALFVDLLITVCDAGDQRDPVHASIAKVAVNQDLAVAIRQLRTAESGGTQYLRWHESVLDFYKRIKWLHPGVKIKEPPAATIRLMNHGFIPAGREIARLTARFAARDRAARNKLREADETSSFQAVIARIEANVLAREALMAGVDRRFRERESALSQARAESDAFSRGEEKSVSAFISVAALAMSMGLVEHEAQRARNKMEDEKRDLAYDIDQCRKATRMIRRALYSADVLPAFEALKSRESKASALSRFRMARSDPERHDQTLSMSELQKELKAVNRMVEAALRNAPSDEQVRATIEENLALAQALHEKNARVSELIASVSRPLAHEALEATGALLSRAPDVPTEELASRRARVRSRKLEMAS